MATTDEKIEALADICLRQQRAIEQLLNFALSSNYMETSGSFGPRRWIYVTSDAGELMIEEDGGGDAVGGTRSARPYFNGIEGGETGSERISKRESIDIVKDTIDSSSAKRGNTLDAGIKMLREMRIAWADEIFMGDYRTAHRSRTILLDIKDDDYDHSENPFF